MKSREIRYISERRVSKTYVDSVPNHEIYVTLPMWNLASHLVVMLAAFLVMAMTVMLHFGLSKSQ